MTTKVFVGNLAFQTTDQALAEAFLDVGKVKSGVVITRGRRSLGYGFVEFEAPESAAAAVNSRNNTLLKGRTIKVELASDNPIRPERSPRERTSTNENPANSGDNAGQRRRPRRRNRNRKTGNSPGGENPSNQNENNRDRERPPAKSRDNNPGGGSGTPNPGPRDNGDPAQRGEQKPRRRRRTTNPNPNPLNPKENVEDRVLSTTAVFVANLPFSVNDEELKAFFKEHNPKSAHVVVTRNNRSRGYGFVDFTTEKDQKLAITGKNNAKFGERVITVTASYKTQETNEN